MSFRSKNLFRCLLLLLSIAALSAFLAGPGEKSVNPVPKAYVSPSPLPQKAQKVAKIRGRSRISEEDMHPPIPRYRAETTDTPPTYLIDLDYRTRPMEWKFEPNPKKSPQYSNYETEAYSDVAREGEKMLISAEAILLQKLGSRDFFVRLPWNSESGAIFAPNPDGMRIAISEPRFRKDKEEILEALSQECGISKDKISLTFPVEK